MNMKGACIYVRVCKLCWLSRVILRLAVSQSNYKSKEINKTLGKLVAGEREREQHIIERKKRETKTKQMQKK